ncbi:MAG: CopD family protein [Bacteroidetes bacterium]|nr:CopD family protein [Bacteroidota bacterium]MDA1268688.1 CopD family protein [Bacteroidota bacterium]
MGFEYVKALHLIFIVTWFAGLFYIVRLFIYQTEALEKPEQERQILKPHLDLMAHRLWYIITWPSAVLTLIFGFWVLTYRWGYLQQEFMQAKLALVLLLYVYHGYSQVLFTELQAGKARWSSTQLRLWNELSTLLLFAIVFLIVLKNTLSMLWGMLGLVGLFLVFLLAIKLYKKYRTR